MGLGSSVPDESVAGGCPVVSGSQAQELPEAHPSTDFLLDPALFSNLQDFAFTARQKTLLADFISGHPALVAAYQNGQLPDKGSAEFDDLLAFCETLKDAQFEGSDYNASAGAIVSRIDKLLSYTQMFVEMPEAETLKLRDKFAALFPCLAAKIRERRPPLVQRLTQDELSMFRNLQLCSMAKVSPEILCLLIPPLEEGENFFHPDTFLMLNVSKSTFPLLAEFLRKNAPQAMNIMFGCGLNDVDAALVRAFLADFKRQSQPHLTAAKLRLLRGRLITNASLGQAHNTVSFPAVHASSSAVKTSSQQEIFAACEINQLSDADMAEIFKRLPPIDRLRVATVCQRWRAMASKAWLDVSHLDLSSIAGAGNISAAVRLCPNLRSVSAGHKTFAPNERDTLSRISRLTSLRLHDCTFNSWPGSDEPTGDPHRSILSGRLQDSSVNELVLHELRLNLACLGKFELPVCFSASLRRLQLSGVSWSGVYVPFDHQLRLLRGIGQSVELECLMLLSPRHDILVGSVLLEDRQFLTFLAPLQNLRELALGCDPRWGSGTSLRPLLSLYRLEALFLDNFVYHRECHQDDFVSLITKHPALRILVLSGYVSANVQFPARSRYANGFDTDPLPQLHVFVGHSASENIQFPKFPSDAAKVWPITEPLPQFLDRADVKQIFEGIWIAEWIRETSGLGSLFSDCLWDLASCYLFRSTDDEGSVYPA